MAKRMAGVRKSNTSERTGIGLWWMFGLLALVLLSAFALPTVVLLLLGMLPAWVAYIVDRGPGKAAGRCVLFLNFAGVAPFLIALWTTGGRGQMDGAFTILTDPMTWFVMYAAAAAGWLIYFGMPYLVGAVVEVRTEHRKRRLAELREKIIAEWGEEIAGAAQPAKK